MRILRAFVGKKSDRKTCDFNPFYPYYVEAMEGMEKTCKKKEKKYMMRKK
jgi:hypothetical protein